MPRRYRVRIGTDSPCPRAQRPSPAQLMRVLIPFCNFYQIATHTDRRIMWARSLAIELRELLFTIARWVDRMENDRRSERTDSGLAFARASPIWMIAPTGIQSNRRPTKL